MGRRFLALCVLGAALVLVGSAAAKPPAYGTTTVLAPVPNPGYPEGIAVRGNTAYVAGPAAFAFGGPAAVWAFDTKTGELEDTILIEGESPFAPRANSTIALDKRGRLYVVNVQLGIVRIDPNKHEQAIYATALPDIPPCPAPAPCSPTTIDRPPLANDIAFGPDGSLYETDSFQATIWRIPPGGGTPAVWFQDSRLDGLFGANGLRLSPDGDRVFVGVTTEDLSGLVGGHIYWLPRVAHPGPADLHTFHAYNGEGPDGFAFGKSGSLYVALANPGVSGISVLDGNGVQTAQIGNPPVGPPLQPFDSPANIAFDGKGNLVVTNHASLAGFLDHFAVLTVFVDDKEAKLFEP